VNEWYDLAIGWAVSGLFLGYIIGSALTTIAILIAIIGSGK